MDVRYFVPATKEKLKHKAFFLGLLIIIFLFLEMSIHILNFLALYFLHYWNISFLNTKSFHFSGHHWLRCCQLSWIILACCCLFFGGVGSEPRACACEVHALLLSYILIRFLLIFDCFLLFNTTCHSCFIFIFLGFNSSHLVMFAF